MLLPSLHQTCEPQNASLDFPIVFAPSYSRHRGTPVDSVNDVRIQVPKWRKDSIRAADSAGLARWLAVGSIPARKRYVLGGPRGAVLPVSNSEFRI